jgi:hypothetical protein
MRALDWESAPASQPPRGTHGLWRRRSFWLGAFSRLSSAIVAAVLALVLIAPPFKSAVVDALLGAHVSSLISASDTSPHDK